jgi:Cu(I)/Ag(I) efflux system membrane fusion protein
MKVFFLGMIALLGIIACKEKKKEATAKTDTFYTCSMHPQVMESKPGKCPICAMELIAVKKSQQKSGDLELSAQQIQLGNIQVDTIKSGFMGDEMVLNATLSVDQNRNEVISARVAGRIDKLYYKNLGDYIPKGAKLYDLYSEDLNNAKQEYIIALERKEQLDNSLIDFARLVNSAKTKLKLWGMSESQIRELAKTRKFSPNTTFYSTASGNISTLDATEGSYVSEGGIIVSMSNLSSLWAEAQLYSSQRSFVNNNSTAVVSFPDFAGKTIVGKISFENPELGEGTRINLIRIEVPNSDNQLKPGMAAYVALKSKTSSSTLSLPLDAVLRDSKGASVWIQTGKNTFRNVMVSLGVQGDDRVEIKSGLKNGDVVVTSGAYLINSEYIFKHGEDPMAGMKM